MATAKAIIAAASELSQAFTGDTRDNGEKFRTLRDGSPEWMTDVCGAAHDAHAMLPDDQRYEMIEEAADAISEADEDDGDFEEARASMVDDVSAYTHDRTAWLASRNDRYAYVDEALEEWGADVRGILDLIALGMMREREEVFGQVLAAIIEYVDGIEEAEEAASENEAAQ